MEYKLYRLDAINHHIVSASALTARDDLDAVQEAERLCELYTVELWQGARWVARVKKGNASLDASDRLCL